MLEWRTKACKMLNIGSLRVLKIVLAKKRTTDQRFMEILNSLIDEFYT
jgi:hypothetical protein